MADPLNSKALAQIAHEAAVIEANGLLLDLHATGARVLLEPHDAAELVRMIRAARQFLTIEGEPNVATPLDPGLDEHQHVEIAGDLPITPADGPASRWRWPWAR